MELFWGAANSVSASEVSSTSSSDLSAESISDADDVLREETADSANWHPLTGDHIHAYGEIVAESSDLSNCIVTSEADLLSIYNPCNADSDCSSADSNAVFGNKMVDLSDLTWTDDKHHNYLSLVEATFVRKMYGREYCSLDLCGHEPECVELNPSFMIGSDSGLPKTWKIEDSHNGLVSSKPFISRNSASVPKVFLNSWVKHFRANGSFYNEDASEVKMPGDHTETQGSRQKTVALMRPSTSYIKDISRDDQLDSESISCSWQPHYNAENMQPIERDSERSRQACSFCEVRLCPSVSEERPLKMLKAAQP